MAESESGSGIVGLAKALPIKEAYVDGIQPAARETGKALGRVASVVNSALRPLKSLQFGWDLLFDRLDGWLEETLKDVDPAEVVEPPSHVAGPVVIGLLYAQDEPLLRELFLRLLATSMTSSTQKHAHPAFAEFIKEMTPLEAELLNAMKKSPKVPVLYVRGTQVSPGHSSPTILSPTASDEEIKRALAVKHKKWHSDGMSTLSCVRRREDTVSAYENLARMGLVRFEPDFRVASDDVYREILLSLENLDLCRRLAEVGQEASFKRGLLELTFLGTAFLRACGTRD